MIISRSGRLAVAALMCACSASAQPDERPGNLWETTSQMSMPGMPGMPAQKMQVCAAKEWNQPPPPPEGQTCQQTNVQRSDNKITWDIACSGQMEMTGQGEITFQGEDSYAGTILFNAGGMTMTVNLTGTKIGECDNPVG